MTRRNQYRNESAGGLFRVISRLFEAWPLLLIIAWYLSPVTLHMRWEYSYYGPYDNKHFTRCYYLGPHGKFEADHLTPKCPFFVMLDTRLLEEAL